MHHQQLTIPGDLAYGKRGSGIRADGDSSSGKIGPDATLLFDVELVALEPQTKELEL
jgi:FKBP-type peptidyl-prolyl cis-trans isomerase